MTVLTTPAEDDGTVVYTVTGTLRADGVHVLVDMAEGYLPGKPPSLRRYALGRALIGVGQSMSDDALANPKADEDEPDEGDDEVDE